MTEKPIPLFPILTAHKAHEDPAGWATEENGQLVIELKDAISKEYLFQCFGNIGFVVLEKSDIGNIRKFRITHFSID